MHRMQPASNFAPTSAFFHQAPAMASTGSLSHSFDLSYNLNASAVMAMQIQQVPKLCRYCCCLRIAILNLSSPLVSSSCNNSWGSLFPPHLRPPSPSLPQFQQLQTPLSFILLSFRAPTAPSQRSLSKKCQSTTTPCSSQTLMHRYARVAVKS